MSIPIARTRPPHRRGIALLMVLTAMAAATTLVMGWLAVQDTSPLIGRNAVRATQARATSLAGLQLAVTLLETDAPWRESHQDGWILQSHAIAGGTVDVRLWDAFADPPSAPDAATTSVLIESTATIDGLSQTATAQATVHPFDGATPGDLSGLAMYAERSLHMQGTSKIRSWRAGTGRRMLGIGAADAGSIVLRGATTRQGTAGADLVLPAEASPGLITGSGRGGLSRSRRQRPIPMSLGGYGLDRSDLPSLGGLANVGLEVVLEHRGDTAQEFDTLLIPGDLVISERSNVVLPAGVIVRIAGDLILEHRAVLSVEPGQPTTIIVGGNVTADGSTIGIVQQARRRQNKPRSASAGSLRLVADPIDHAHWTFGPGTIIAAQIDAPRTHLIANGITAVGRIAAQDIELDNTRLWYDASVATGAGLCALANTIDRLDLLDRRDAGLDGTARTAVLDRLASLVDVANTRHGRPIAPPSGDFWLMRPVLVEAQMNQFGGDTDSWEAAALATADGQSP
jgi:hypothetical protein